MNILKKMTLLILAFFLIQDCFAADTYHARGRGKGSKKARNRSRSRSRSRNKSRRRSVSANSRKIISVTTNSMQEAGVVPAVVPVVKPDGTTEALKTVTFNSEAYAEALKTFEVEFNQEALAKLGMITVIAPILRGIYEGAFTKAYTDIIKGKEEGVKKQIDDIVLRSKDSELYNLALGTSKVDGKSVDNSVVLAVALQRNFASEEFVNPVGRTFGDRLRLKGASFGEMFLERLNVEVSRYPEFFNKTAAEIVQDLHKQANDDGSKFVEVMAQNLKDQLSSTGLVRLLIIASLKENKEFMDEYKAIIDVKAMEVSSISGKNLEKIQLGYAALIAEGFFRSIVEVFGIKIPRSKLKTTLMAIGAGAAVAAVAGLTYGYVKYGGFKGLGEQINKGYESFKEKAGEFYEDARGYAGNAWQKTKESTSNAFTNLKNRLWKKQALEE